MFGTISGWLDSDGTLDINGGWLNIGGTDHAVLAGTLGGTDARWSITIDGFGQFFFESSLDLGEGKPNKFDGGTFILWGQNQAAYTQDGNSYGIDLYGVRQVPEPGTLALLGIGLFGLGLAHRRKAAIAA